MMQALADNSATSLVPFGHATIQDDVLNCPFFYFWRQLACLEMPQRRFDTMPFAQRELVQMVADHRERATVDIVVATIDDVKNAVQAFLDDPWSAHCHKRWVCKILSVKKFSCHDEQYWHRLVDDIVLSCRQHLIFKIFLSYTMFEMFEVQT